ncbi:hypothetical protein [Oscillibacter sp.]|uniref:hypothetical protein n=1 Tax=Oscillibacter sp. TaxID=1945593 RepID=UPI003391129E
MSVKNAVDYYNSCDIQVGDIVIIDDSRPQSCENGRIVEPYTRLRIRALEVAPYSTCGEVRAQLETEHESIPLAQAVNLLNMHEQPMLQKAGDWLKATETSYGLAQKKSKVYGKLNPKQFVSLVISSCILFLIVAICFVMRMENASVLASSDSGLRIVLGSVVGAVAGTIIAGVLIPKINAMDDARKQAADLEEQLHLYRLANPDCTDVIAIDSVKGGQEAC